MNRFNACRWWVCFDVPSSPWKWAETTADQAAVYACAPDLGVGVRLFLGTPGELRRMIAWRYRNREGLTPMELGGFFEGARDTLHPARLQGLPAEAA